jgi:hypothetical protein
MLYEDFLQLSLEEELRQQECIVDCILRGSRAYSTVGLHVILYTADISIGNPSARQSTHQHTPRIDASPSIRHHSSTAAEGLYRVYSIRLQIVAEAAQLLFRYQIHISLPCMTTRTVRNTLCTPIFFTTPEPNRKHIRQFLYLPFVCGCYDIETKCDRRRHASEQIFITRPASRPRSENVARSQQQQQPRRRCIFLGRCVQLAIVASDRRRTSLGIVARQR